MVPWLCVTGAEIWDYHVGQALMPRLLIVNDTRRGAPLKRPEGSTAIFRHIGIVEWY